MYEMTNLTWIQPWLFTDFYCFQIRAGHGFLLVYAINNRKNFDRQEEYREAISNVKDVESYPAIILGNKCDLESERKVSFQDGIDVSKKFDSPFFETSAKTRVNVDEAFFGLVKQIRCFEETKKQITPAKEPSSKCKCVLL